MGRYSWAECTRIKKARIEGSPGEAYVSNSHIERKNITMRMQMTRFAHPSNAFSKNFEDHAYIVTLYTVWYNYVKMHKKHWMSPAMAAGMSERL